jgi:hypothetical protein
MSAANRPNSVEPGVIVRAGNQEWVIGQIQENVEVHVGVQNGIRAGTHTEAPFAERKNTEKIVTLSALEDARRTAERNIRKQAAMPEEQKRSLNDNRLSKMRFYFPLRFHHFLIWIGALFVRLTTRITRHSTISDSFRSGLIFGLALGCMSLLLFHQVASPGRTDAGLRDTVGTPTSGVLTRGIAVPGIHVYGLCIGSYTNSRAALLAAKTYSAKGIPTAVVHLDKYVLLNQIAVQSRDLNGLVKSLKSNKVPASILPIDAPAQSYPVLPSASAEDLSKTSSWLASETSALVTLASFATDGGRQVDAAHAFQNANALYPSDTVISATGLGVALSQLQKAVEDGNSALAKGDKQGVKTCVMRGYQILLDGQGSNF